MYVYFKYYSVRNCIVHRNKKHGMYHNSTEIKSILRDLCCVLFVSFSSPHFAVYYSYLVINTCTYITNITSCTETIEVPIRREIKSIFSSIFLVFYLSSHFATLKLANRTKDLGLVRTAASYFYHIAAFDFLGPLSPLSCHELRPFSVQARVRVASHAALAKSRCKPPAPCSDVHAGPFSFSKQEMARLSRAPIAGALFALLSRLLAVSMPVENASLPSAMLQDLSKRTNVSMEKYEEAERAILDSHTRLSHGSPSFFLGASHEMTEHAQNLSRKALRIETMSAMLVEALNMSQKQATSVLASVAVTNCVEPTPTLLQLTSECMKTDPHFRTHTGRCNNALHPTWGAALEAYARFLAPEYVDGVSLPRTDLPSAREVSSTVHSGGSDVRHPYLMALTALFGQFLVHDLAHTPKMELPDGAKLKCCDVEFQHFHPECFPIRANNRVGCMEYSRSAPHPGNSLRGYKLGPRQQINQASSYLDLSPVYGSSERLSKALRSGTKGLLNTQRKNLPMASQKHQTCRTASKAFPCFLSGDARINENPGLTLMHVLFLREHNRVATELALLNPQWNDERLYQEARRIVVAEMQHIAYNEFLPLVLGESTLDKYGLRLMHRGFFRGYDSRADATLSNAAASAGLFFVATLTPKTLDLVDARSAFKSGERSLLSAFYAPQEFYEAGAVDRLIAGATAGHSRKPLPPGLNEILLERYFHDGNSDHVAVDYAAQVIQQGRDHGLPAYVSWRENCHLPRVRHFEDLAGSMTKLTIERLAKVYKTVQDIDLATGLLSEAPLNDSVLGPTFLCLLGRTFRNVRVGDRYWYENANSPGSFTIEQLEEVRKATMAQILCRNGERLSWMQPKAFLLRDPFLNEMVNCSIHAASSPNLALWKQQSDT